MRSYSAQATVLKVSQAGENNRTVTLLTPDEGIIHATLYGGAKSRLRSLVSPFNKGTVYLYRDQSKNTCKLTDFDVKAFHLSFRENLFKTYAASFGAEIIIKSKCAGSPDQSFYLYNGLLDGMELSTENDSRLGLIRFLWRYTGVLGVKPETLNCGVCGKSFMSGKLGENSVKYSGAYSEMNNCFICSDCRNQEKYTHILSQEALTYLQAVSSLSPKEVRAISVDQSLLNELKDFCYFMIEHACGTRFMSLESGISIL